MRLFLFEDKGIVYGLNKSQAWNVQERIYAFASIDQAHAARLARDLRPAPRALEIARLAGNVSPGGLCTSKLNSRIIRDIPLGRLYPHGLCVPSTAFPEGEALPRLPEPL